MKVVTAVVNNPLFIELQYYSLKKYIPCDFEYIVFNDAKDFPDFTNNGDVAMRKKIHIPHMITDNRYTKHIIPNEKLSNIIFDINELREKYKDILDKPLLFGC